MQLYREENINQLLEAIFVDEYDDSAQDESLGQEELPPIMLQFLRMFLCEGTILEIGCGSGDLFSSLPITHAVEPNLTRLQRARGVGSVQCEQAVAECLPYEDGAFDTVLMLNGFFQVRSDYEALMEINRALRHGGRFLLNLITNDALDVVQGRCYGPRNFTRTAQQFGFELVARLGLNAGPRFFPEEQTTVVLCLEKRMDFVCQMLNLPQVPREQILNYYHPRDWRLI